MKQITIAAILGLLIVGPASARAEIVDWTLPAIPMDDGSQVSGNFSWESDTNEVVDWSFVLTDGTNTSFPAATLDPSTSVASTSTRYLRFVHNTITMGTTPVRGLELRLGVAALDDLDTPVSSLPLDSGLDPAVNLGSFFCYNCSPVLWPTERGILTSLPPASSSFSIAIIPDTQMYVERHPEVFEAQIDWIVANEVTENIIYVAHLGDLKDDLSCDTKTVNLGTGGGRSEWQIVDQALGDLDAAGIPYGVVPGNHDFDQVSGTCPNFTTQRPLGTYNALLGPTRFAGQPYYGDPSVPTPGNRVVNSNEDNFTLFESSGVKLIAINLAYKQAANPVGSDPELVWADALLKAYPDRLGIVTSHYFVEANPDVGAPGARNQFGSYGQEVYDALSDNPNLFMMLSAHEWGEAWRVETTGRGGMQPVQVLLSDYQRDVFPSVDGDPNTPPNDPNPAGINFTNIGQNSFGDSGFMRIMRFDTVTGMVNVSTFIPPVIPIKNRPGTLVSTYFPASGAGMDASTASNISFTYLGYVP